MNVLIVDDHPMVMEYLRNAVARALPDAIVRSATDLETALDMAQECELDMVLLDLGLPGCGGIESLLRFRKAYPAIRVLVVSANDDTVSVRGALAAGAAGFIPKTAGPKVIVNALRLVAEGGRYIPPEALGEDAEPPAAPAAIRRDAGQPPQSGLTGRQAEVLARLLAGRNIRQIADELGIAEATAKHHALAVYAAYGVSSRADLIIAATRRGTGTG
jgi:DNA-binding NarL/FixJ family response regulator